MLLYLDDDSVDRVLIRRLIDGGHEVLTPVAARTAGHADPVHLMCAIRTGRVVLTHDHEDFTLLHELVLFSGGHLWSLGEITIQLGPCLPVPLSVPSTNWWPQVCQFRMQFMSSTTGVERANPP